MFILNDVHLGANRRAGATPTSAAALKSYLQASFADLVGRCSGHLCILGDLFDGFTVDVNDVIAAHVTLSSYLRSDNTLTLVAGNHDFHRNGDKTSSFHLLAHILQAQYPAKVNVIDDNNGLTKVEEGVWAIPHMPNQTLFDLEIEKAVANQDVKHLLLHCNIDNPFAEHSDASLNLSGTLLDKVLHSGIRVVCAHEHAGRVLHNGRIHIIGNQVPSSVSDCLNDLNEYKVFVEISNHEVIEHLACRVHNLYAKLDWRNLDDVDPSLKFIRVGGDASANEAADAVAAIAKLRQNHEAFVITNAVMVEGMGTEMEEASLESLKAFDVLSALLEVLDPKEQEVVKELLTC